MTFKEWVCSTDCPIPAGTSWDDERIVLAKKAWDAATMDEREECAKLTDAHFIPGHSVAGPHFAAVLANKIRERSN